MSRPMMVAAAAAALLMPAFIGPALAGPVLDAVKARGSLICGTGTGTAGYMLADSTG